VKWSQDMKNHKQVTIPNDTYDMVKVFATQCDIPMSKVITVAIEKHVSESQGEIPPADEKARKKWLIEQMVKMVNEM
jgi:hypothetical protein